jgi:hypothetical protein
VPVVRRRAVMQCDLADRHDRKYRVRCFGLGLAVEQLAV